MSCPNNINYKESKGFLKKSTKLNNDKYEVCGVLGQGGFGITYLCVNDIGKKFAIKEYYPSQIVNRDTNNSSIYLNSSSYANDYDYGKEKFLQEAKTLSKFDHQNIINVIDYFEENDTIYMVMEYLDGQTLTNFVESNGKLSEQQAKDLLIPILDALKELHNQNILHRDIKPDNVYISNSGRPILIDFGSAKLVSMEHSESFSTIVSHGYAPPEQYRQKAKFGSYTDIYAVGATLYYALTGVKPPSAIDRETQHDRVELESISKYNTQISDELSNIIYKMMDINYQNRFDDINSIVSNLTQKTTANEQMVKNTIAYSDKEFENIWYASKEKINSSFKFLVFSDRGKLNKSNKTLSFKGKTFDFDNMNIIELSRQKEILPWGMFGFLFFIIFLVLMSSLESVVLSLIISLFVMVVNTLPYILIRPNWIKVKFKNEIGKEDEAYFADGTKFGWGGVLGGTNKLFDELSK
ncbi:MAG: serine/threonine-protein kinase [Campylobacterota bacterium]|nr:serine/threonine-protein kinase [Campylobacterota bacterium]